jgi:hypothetical protein
MLSPRFSRRSFLKSTLAAGAAPLLLPARVWAAETKPNDRLTLGFIGIGKQARGLMSGFLGKSETQAVAVCDVDTNRRTDGKKQVDDFYAKQAGSNDKGCATYNDFRELLARKDIDAVVIATPDHWHALIAIAATQAGKDIYCEKPLTETIHEARALVAAVRQNGRVFQTGSMQRSSREFRVACELVRNGVIGKVARVEAGFGGPGKPCDLPEQPAEDGLDWDMWQGPAPARGYNEILSPRGVHQHFPAWRAYREYGGAPSRHRAVGPRHGRQRTDRNHPASRLADRRSRREAALRERRRGHAHQGKRRDLFWERRRGVCQPRQDQTHAARR